MQTQDCTTVVPHAGTWIEINETENVTENSKVVPHAGTWIEIYLIITPTKMVNGRSPRGNVD